MCFTPRPETRRLILCEAAAFTLHEHFAGKDVRLCLTSRFDIPRQNACASYQN
jgi:hypothetical protein